MFTTTFVPDKNNHTVEIPEEYYGKEVTIIVDAPILKSNRDPLVNKVELLNQSLKGYRTDLSSFKFDRGQANNYE